MTGDVGANATVSACKRWGRRIGVGLPWVCLALAILMYRIHAEGTREMRRSDRAFDRGELGAAMDHARQAALWYLPAAPHVEQARQRLRAIAMGAETGGEPELALRAWGALRAVLHETRHVGSMGAELWQASNQGTLRLLSRAQPAPSSPSGAAPGLALDPAERAPSNQAKVRRAGYARPEGSAPHWALATTLGMATMLLAGGWLSLRARGWSESWGARLAFAAGLSLWVMAALGA